MKRCILALAVMCATMIGNGLHASTQPFAENQIVVNPIVAGDDPFQIETNIPAIVKEVEEINNEIRDLLKDKDSTTEEKVEKATKIVKHIVEKGDSLWAIAQKLLGDGSRYREIIEANKDKYPSLEKNPDLIYSGWELEIPIETEMATDSGNIAAASGNEEIPDLTVDNSSGSSTAQVNQIPVLTVKEKVKKLQNAVDSANRRLLSQNKRIAALNPSTIRFLIDNGFMTEEEWMAMNPPAGYTYRLDRLGKVELVNAKNQPLSNEDIEKLDEANAKAAEVARAKAAEEKKKKEQEKKNSLKETDKDKQADKKEENPAEKDKETTKEDENKKIEEEAQKAADTRYAKMLAEMGMPDVSDSKAYYKAVRSGSKLLSKGFFGGTTQFYKFVNSTDYPDYNISDLQRELKTLQAKYEKLVREGKTDRFLGIFGSTIESTGKQIEQKKEKLQKAWSEMKKALDASKAKAAELESSIKEEKDKIASLQKKLDAMDIYDASNAAQVQATMKEIKESKEKIEDAQEKLESYEIVKAVFKL